MDHPVRLYTSCCVNVNHLSFFYQVIIVNRKCATNGASANNIVAQCNTSYLVTLLVLFSCAEDDKNAVHISDVFHFSASVT